MNQRVYALFVATAVSILGFAANANADAATVIALDLDFATPVSAPETKNGGGGALRVGRKHSIVLASLTPEVGFGYHHFGGNNDATLYRGFLGGRLGVGSVIEPSVYAHIGLGKFDHSIRDRLAPVVDAGVALDLTLLPLVNLGVHGAYNSILPRHEYPSLNWFSVGLHVALVL